MDSKEILQFCLRNGLLMDKEVLGLFSEADDFESVKVVIENIKNTTQKKFITKDLFEKNKEQVGKVFDNLPKEYQKSLERVKIKLGLSIEITKEIEIKRDPVKEESLVKITSMSLPPSKKLEVKDFVTYFRNRYDELKNILCEHSELNNLVSIGKLSGSRGSVSVIGMVSSKRVTKNKNIILEIEDLTGKLKILINKDKKDLVEKADEIPLDAVLGFKGTGNNEILFVNDIVFPETRLPERKRGNVDEYALFIGDVHVGSKLFMEKSFLNFIDYLNGNVSGTEDEVKKIKYLFIVGDLIAGVGVYPSQEPELTFPDLELQFQKAAEYLSKIRKDIKIIISPGNHDGVRLMEPQPLFDEKYAWPLYELDNVILTGNPAQVSIGAQNGFSGFDVAVYHGFSYFYYISNIWPLIQANAAHSPELVMKFLLKHRHFAPTHSSTQYFPAPKDPLLIRNIPDIFVSGHTHKSAITYHNNILVVSVSAWEKMTPYEEKQGADPDYCKVPMFNLKTGAVKILDFEDYEEEGDEDGD